MKQRSRGLDPRKTLNIDKRKSNRYPNQTVDVKDLPLPKPKLTLQEARQQYRKQNKKCEYCEFCSREVDFEDLGGVIAEYDILWCLVKDEKCDNKPCEFYQVKE